MSKSLVQGLATGTGNWGGVLDPSAGDVTAQNNFNALQSTFASLSSAKSASRAAKLGFLALNPGFAGAYALSFLEPVRRHFVGAERFDAQKAADKLREKLPKNKAQQATTLFGLIPRSAAQSLAIAVLGGIGPTAAVIGSTYQGPGASVVRPVLVTTAFAAILGYALCQTKQVGDYLTGRNTPLPPEQVQAEEKAEAGKSDQATFDGAAETAP